jgi:purine catabolism regulator
MLIVSELVDQLGLELVAGKQAGDAPIRWVHISELTDPTPWMSGGELLLTTGMRLREPEEQRDYVRLLVDHHLAGLGFGTGFEHKALPAAISDEAERLGLPLFEVPYEMPFIAITEKAFSHLVNEQYEVLQRSIAVQRRLEQLVLEGRGLEELARSLSVTLGGAVAILDAEGQTVATARFRRELPGEAISAIREEIARRVDESRVGSFEPAHDAIAGRGCVVPVAPETRGGPQAWLIAVRDVRGLGEFERMIIQQAAIVVALELMRRRVERETERRLAGDVLAEAIESPLSEHELRARMGPFGVGSQAAVLVFAVDEPDRLEPLLGRALSDAGVPALVARRESLLCAVIDGKGRNPVEIAARMQAALEHEAGSTRAGASRVAPLARLRRSFHEARYALEVSAVVNGGSPEVASWEDLGAFQLLLSVQDDEALRLYCDNVLGPIENGEGEYGDELIKSLHAFLEHNGQWEKAARELYCHRHTLRYRVRRIEQLTGRDLGNARDRIEFWLALRARELISS